MVQIDFDKFKKATSYDIRSFFVRFTDFMKNYYGDIVSFYSGGEFNGLAFNKLDELLNDVKIIEPLFVLTDSLSGIDMWELLDLFTETQTKLYTIENTGKWLKSSRLNKNSVETKFDKIQNQNETFENIASNAGYTNPQDDWKEIAINNHIVEEDYTVDGGKIFSITLQNNLSVGLANIIDYNTGTNILGKDIDRKITFENNDLKVLCFSKAIDQSFGIKISTQKNSIPEFPNNGVDNSIIGTNSAAISYPVLFRDLLNLFKGDFRWSEVNLIDIKRVEDKVMLSFEAKTILKDTLITNINI